MGETRAREIKSTVGRCPHGAGPAGGSSGTRDSRQSNRSRGPLGGAGNASLSAVAREVTGEGVALNDGLFVLAQ